MDKLGIDIVLLGTQIVNFGIILYILNRFAYKPLLKLLDKRRQEIADGVHLKEQMQERAEELEKEKQKTLEEARREGQRMIKSAIAEAKKRGQEISAEEKNKIKQERKDALEEIERERKKIVAQAKDQALQYAVLISEKLLGKKMDRAEQQRLLKEVVGELKKS